MELQLRLILQLLLVLTIFEDLGLNAEAKGVLLIPRRRIDFNSGFSGGQGAMMRSFQAMREDPRSIYRKTYRRGGVFDEPMPSSTERWSHDKEASDWNANDISASVSEENEPNRSVMNDEGSTEEIVTTLVPIETGSSTVTTPQEVAAFTTATTTSAASPTTTFSTTATPTTTTTTVGTYPTTSTSTTTTTTTTTTTPPSTPIQKELESSTVKTRILRKSCGIRCGLF